MKCARAVVPAGSWTAASATDRVVLEATERYRRRIMLTGERGTKFLLDLPHAGLGATLTPLDAPFDPEGGAYHEGHHGHDHGV
jgi:urease accessory protein UreE